MPLVWLGMAGIVGAVAGLDAVAIVGPVVLVLGLAMYFRVGTVRAVPEEVVVPVAGRWTALNSPASWVPSYGLHAYGQTYAIDLVHEPLDRTRPAFGWRPLSLPPASFPAFGQRVFAPVGGVVVRAHDRQRDHRSRNSWPALGFLMVEGMLRELLGPARILGNHVVIDRGDGAYAPWLTCSRARCGWARATPSAPYYGGWGSGSSRSRSWRGGCGASGSLRPPAVSTGGLGHHVTTRGP
jgi:hypothetical protein